MAFTPITVTRRYLYDDLSPAVGEVRFTPTALMDNAGSVVTAPRVGKLDAAGDLTIVVAANDDPATLPPGVNYRVDERISGAVPRTYYVVVPHDAAGGTVDLAALTPAMVPPVVTYPVAGPTGPTGATGATGPAGAGVPNGGTTGYVLAKASSADQDTEWYPVASAAEPDTIVARNTDLWTELRGIWGLVDPTMASHAANKGYVDDSIAGVVDDSTSYPTELTLVWRRDDGGGKSRSDFDIVGITLAPTAADHAANKQYVDGAVAALLASAPAALDTLNELANALGGDANFATTMATALGLRLRVDVAQSLTGPQQAQARTNLGLAALAASGSASDVSSGTLAAARLPRVLSPVTALVGQTGAISTDAATAGNFLDWTCTGNVTFNAPTNPTNHQILHASALASGGARTVALGAGVLNASGATFPLPVPSGKVGRISVEYFGLLAAWVVTAAVVTP